MRLIDADALIKAIHDEWDEVLVWDESGETTAYEFERLVDDAPTIEPKQGRWEMYGAITRGTLAIPIYRCSECKEDTNNWFWHYCPNCGARMDE